MCYDTIHAILGHQLAYSCTVGMRDPATFLLATSDNCMLLQNKELSVNSVDVSLFSISFKGFKCGLNASKEFPGGTMWFLLWNLWSEGTETDLGWNVSSTNIRNGSELVPFFLLWRSDRKPHRTIRYRLSVTWCKQIDMWRWTQSLCMTGGWTLCSNSLLR